MAREPPSGGARLRHLVLMVGEAQIQTAAVDVELVAQIAVAHRRAFQMPAGAAHAERRRPACGRRVGRLRALPQREVARVVLVGRGVGGVDRIVFVVARVIHARTHAVGHGGGLITGSGAGHGLLLVGQLAVPRPAGHVEVHVAGRVAGLIEHHIAVAVVQDAPDQVDHVQHVACGARLVGGRQHAQRVVRLGELALVDVGALPPLLAGGRGLVQDLVVDVGHVAHERDRIAQTQQPAAHHVERHGRADMADMRRALHGRAAHVDAHMARLDRDERFDRMRGGVV